MISSLLHYVELLKRIIITGVIVVILIEFGASAGKLADFVEHKSDRMPIRRGGIYKRKIFIIPTL